MSRRSPLATLALGAALLAAVPRSASAATPAVPAPPPATPPGPASMPAETLPAESEPATLPARPVETGPAGPPAAPPREVAPKAAEESKVRTPAWITCFIGVTAAALGTALSSVAYSRTRLLIRERENGEREWRRWEELTTEGSELSIGAYTLVFAGAAVSAAGFYLLLRKEKDPGFVIAASPARGGGMASVRVGF